MNAIVLLFPTWALAPQKSLKKQRSKERRSSGKAEKLRRETKDAYAVRNQAPPSGG